MLRSVSETKSRNWNPGWEIPEPKTPLLQSLGSLRIKTVHSQDSVKCFSICWPKEYLKETFSLIAHTCMHMNKLEGWERGRSRGRERISSRLHGESRAWLGAPSHDPVMTWKGGRLTDWAMQAPQKKGDCFANVDASNLSDSLIVISS